MKGDETKSLSNWKVSGSNSTNASALGAIKTSSSSEEDVSSPFAALPDEVMEDILWHVIFAKEDGDYGERRLDVRNMLSFRQVSRQWSRCMPYKRLAHFDYDDFECQAFDSDGVVRFLLPRVGPFLATLDFHFLTVKIADPAINTLLQAYCPNFQGFTISEDLEVFEDQTEWLEDNVGAVCECSHRIKRAVFGDLNDDCEGPLFIPAGSKLKTVEFMLAVSKIPDVKICLPSELFNLAKEHLIAPGLNTIRIELSSARRASQLETIFENCPNIHTVFLRCKNSDCLSSVDCAAKCTKLKTFKLEFAFSFDAYRVEPFDLSGVVSVQRKCSELKILSFILGGNFLPPGLLEHCGSVEELLVEWGSDWPAMNPANSRKKFGDYFMTLHWMKAICWDKLPAANSLSLVKFRCNAPYFHLRSEPKKDRIIDLYGSHRRRQVLMMSDYILEDIKAANIRLKILDLQDETVNQSGKLTVKGLVSYLDFCGDRMETIYFPFKACNLYGRKRLWRAFSRAKNLKNLYLNSITVCDLEKVKNTFQLFVNQRVAKMDQAKTEMSSEKVSVLRLWNLPFKSQCWIENSRELGREFLRRGNIFLAGNGSNESSTSSDDASDSDSD